MPYREPKLQIFQDFEPALNAGAEPLFACLVGPNFELHRFSEEDERARIADYDRTVQNIYAWPDKIAGGIIDLDSAEVWVDQALVRYYESLASATNAADNVNKVTSTVVFKSNAAADRDAAAFGDRDVQVGDTAILRWNDGSSQVFETIVAGFEADVVAGSTNPTALDRVIGFGSIALGGSELPVDPASATPERLTLNTDASSYDGLSDGWPSDTYLIRVVQAGYNDLGPGGNLDNTILNITSTGNDVETTVELGVDVIFDGAKYPVPLGSRGGILEISENGGFVPTPANEGLYAGNAWNCVVSQQYDEIDPTDATAFLATGPYTGTQNTQYILTVVLGGTVGTDDLVFNLTTNNGADQNTQFTVPAADFPPTQNDYSVGIRGMQLSFFSTATKNQWRTGDVITFDVEGQSEGPIHTLIFTDVIPALAATDFDLDLHTVETIQLESSFRTFTQDDITIEANATTLSDLLGTPEPMAIMRGVLYADYREQRTVGCEEIRTITTRSEVLSILGPTVPENPLAMAAALALQNSGGQTIYYIATCSDDVAGYQRALDILTENDAVHGLVPLTQDNEVEDLFAAHVSERSSADNNQWRITWITNTVAQIIGVYVADGSGNDLTATVEEFSPGLYRKVVSPGSLFETNGVQAGDRLRINYSTDIDGNVTYDEYVIDRVDSETELILTASLPGAITVAVKIEVWRNQSNNDYAASLAAEPQRYNNRRVYMVWADNPVTFDGEPLDMIYVAAALAGQRSGVAPHAPLSQVELSGFTLDPTVKFSRGDLTTIASGGNWLVIKDFEGRVFTRHQLSTITNPDDLDQREQSKTTNLDHISRDMFLNTRDLFGQGNVSDAMLALIEQRLESRITAISNRPYPDKIGPQMQGAQILRLEVDEVLRDTVIVEIDPALPDPLNTLIIRFRVNANQ
jgi:hypothetical protein